MPNNPPSLETEIAVIARDIKYIKNEMGEIRAVLHEGYVTQDEFEPVRRLVYGGVAVVLVAVLTAVLGLVIISGVRL